MSEQREPDHTDDPRGQDVGDGYPEINEEGADPAGGGFDDPDESDDEEE